MQLRNLAAGLIVGGILVTILGVTIFPRSTAQETSQPDTTENYHNIFADKIVGITFDDSTAVVRGDDYSWMTNVKIINIGGRDFIVGESYVPEGENYKEYQVYKGMTAGYPAERVKSFRTYSVEQFQARVKSSDELKDAQ
jgi:hypothetical protein